MGAVFGLRPLTFCLIEKIPVGIKTLYKMTRRVLISEVLLAGASSDRILVDSNSGRILADSISYQRRFLTCPCSAW